MDMEGLIMDNEVRSRSSNYRVRSFFNRPTSATNALRQPSCATGDDGLTQSSLVRLKHGNKEGGFPAEQEAPIASCSRTTSACWSLSRFRTLSAFTSPSWHRQNVVKENRKNVRVEKNLKHPSKRNRPAGPKSGVAATLTRAQHRQALRASPMRFPRLWKRFFLVASGAVAALGGGGRSNQRGSTSSEDSAAAAGPELQPAGTTQMLQQVAKPASLQLALSDPVEEGKKGAYFYLSEGQTRTFVKVLDEGQVFSVKYTVSEDRATHCRLEFRDTNGVVRNTKNVAPNDKGESAGKFSILTNMEGEHSFSVICGETNWWGNQLKSRWTVALETAAIEDADASNIANLYEQRGLVKAKDINTLDALLKESVSQTDLIAAENEYEKKQLAKFEYLLESAISTMMSVNLGMIFLILVTSIWQVWHLKHFFRVQKLL
ncbi:unnamed protein product [Amoebophrya sp. A120]|nr:unnamed protein product [Amoebophrya sp. A120]|eukprot:GSA120T00001520001.1